MLRLCVISESRSIGSLVDVCRDDDRRFLKTRRGDGWVGVNDLWAETDAKVELSDYLAKDNGESDGIFKKSQANFLYFPSESFGIVVNVSEPFAWSVPFTLTVQSKPTRLPPLFVLTTASSSWSPGIAGLTNLNPSIFRST